MKLFGLETDWGEPCLGVAGQWSSHLFGLEREWTDLPILKEQWYAGNQARSQEFLLGGAISEEAMTFFF